MEKVRFTPKSIDEYIAAFPTDVQKILVLSSARDRSGINGERQQVDGRGKRRDHATVADRPRNRRNATAQREG